MNETQVRELLRDKAEEIRLDPHIPRPVLRRARRRRVATVMVAGVVAAGVALGGMAGLRAFLVAEPPVRPADPQWRGIWPQATRADAEAAQTCADRGDPQCTWQLDGEEVIRRYAVGELKWTDAFFDPSLDILDAQGAGPLTIGIGDCPEFVFHEFLDQLAGSAGIPCPRSAEIAVERLLRGNDTGIWLVTGVQLRESPVDPERGAPEARLFVRDFMEARVIRAESALADLMSPEARDQYDEEQDGLSLYGPVNDPAFIELSYRLGRIESIDANAFEVVVRITERFETGDDRTYRERLFVGPGDTVRGDSMPLVVRGATRFGSP